MKMIQVVVKWQTRITSMGTQKVNLPVRRAARGVGVTAGTEHLQVLATQHCTAPGVNPNLPWCVYTTHATSTTAVSNVLSTGCRSLQLSTQA